MIVSGVASVIGCRRLDASSFVFSIRLLIDDLTFVPYLMKVEC